MQNWWAKTAYIFWSPVALRVYIPMSNSVGSIFLFVNECTKDMD